MKRGLLLILSTAIGAWLGGKTGIALSYWFAPDIMRLYLSWSEYLSRLQAQLYQHDPIGLYRVVVTCHLLGTVCGVLLGLYVYRRIKPRK